MMDGTWQLEVVELIRDGCCDTRLNHVRTAEVGLHHSLTVLSLIRGKAG